jgi:hypothetical protein
MMWYLLRHRDKYTLSFEGVSKSFRTGHLERDCKWYSSLPLGAVVSLLCESV